MLRADKAFVMGFMSRKILPACGSLCVFCPALRARSRQPVKRYKKLIADVFQEVLPNDRKISKLCDYASRNPLRSPKIATMLEQRGYKALRNGQLGAIRAVVAIYVKLFSACKVQMPLFAVSAINMIRALLDENQQDEVRVFGCTLLFEFAYNQVDGTYIYQLDALLLNLCSLAKEFGEERRQRQLRSAGLRALSALIWYMGEHLHMPSEYNHVVSVIMDNYGHPFVSADDNTSAVEIPSVWAQLCVEKISQFCKEATTTRRYLEPIFFYFDIGKHWSPRGGLALTVLQQILHFLETFGNDSFLLVVLMRHLDHKSVSQDPHTKSDIVSIAASLIRQSKSKTTTIDMGILSDILRHLRNTLIATMEVSLQPVLADYTDLQLAIQKLLLELVKKIGSPAPIFETMALTLETLPTAAQFCRSTMHSLLIFGSIMASQPLVVTTQQCFPEALLQQLALAMAHPDCDTRLGVHQVFETILSSLSVLEKREDFSSSVSYPTPIKTGLSSAPSLNSTHVQSGFGRDVDSAAIRLSEDQVGLLFSSLWRGSSLDNNMPGNYQANFSTFALILQLSPARVSKDIFARAFQLTLSLRTTAIQIDGRLSPSRKRSLFMLSSAMLAFASKFYNITGIADQIKALCARGQMDPYLMIVESGLRVVDGVDASQYGTPADDDAASEWLDKMRKEVKLSNESLVSSILSSASMIDRTDLDWLRSELLQPFSPVHGGFASGLDAESNRARPWIAVLCKSSSFDEVIDSKDDFIADNAYTDLPKFLMNNSARKPSADVIGVTQLLKSALEMAGQVARVKAGSPDPLSFSAVAMKCEDFGASARRKMPIWTNIDDYNQTLPLMSSHHYELLKGKDASARDGVQSPPLTKPDQVSNYKPCQTLQLPPVSHYDNFLRAAGC